MAKPNYSYEKRQREIAKQKKKAEKLARKQAGKDTDEAPADAASEPAPAAPIGSQGS